ncbi:MAG TPA: adenylate/guanylate cyclase domain-containing protein [Stellaceae bacterium]|nr:adenylate/guanylate cyclase domain-containing protein [Stellaceae bacterium]
MQAPETRYAKSGDVHIAYQVVGNGPFDLVFVPGFVTNLDLIWETPAYGELLPRLAAFSRLIVFDKRGTGLSDRMAGIASLEERMDDVRAVMDAARCERAALVGVSEGGPMSLLFAATYPGRARALVLYGSYARHPTLSRENIGEHVELIDRLWGTGEYIVRFIAPSRAADESFRRLVARSERLSASPSAAAAILRMNSEIDASHIVPTIRVPTLVLHRVGDPRVTVDAGRYLATHIPGAKYVELPGNDHGPYGIVDRMADEIEEFLTGTRTITEPDRVLATVMFTDIVDSTKRAAEMGDRGWRTLLERHDEAARHEIERFRGRAVKSLGDGFLATFDGPARAVRCAAAISASVRPLGIAIRSGLHTGEIEIKKDDIAGIAVHIAARVAEMAGAGEVLVSNTVRDLVAGSGLRFADRGSHALKGLPEALRLYAAEGQ